ncbi:MAG TPA: PSD1 and planctomycete cytochrome C domain-containing protein [Planctomycetota bacterium]|nr:PSD1 and planctomycete cytochrome C domain-containing protein [Planctomycetota bacterium]
MKHLGILAVATMMLLGTPASSVAVQEGEVDFIRDVQPVLEAHCLSCHGQKKQKGRLRLDSKGAALRGGVSGAVLIPGRSKESRLFQVLLDPNPDERMPKDADPLKKEQIDILRRWIDRGAAWPDTASVKEPKAELHWAYIKPGSPSAPSVKDPHWPRNPIDQFVARERELRGLSPRPEAPRPVLLRRVFLDLIGLPPTRAELEAFLTDLAPNAYERVVDRLLADPRYGERWGRHWMDIWRYSDMSEFEQNQILSSQRHLWRWRDWIVESLNADKGYDRMIQEMLAADELAPLDPDTLRATGFLARNYYKLNRNVWLDLTVEHTTKAFLATTLNCARCHNHFFDPLSQEEYYKVRAFFEPYDVRTDPVPGEPDPVKDGLARVYDAHADDPTYLFVRGEDRSPDKTRSLPPEVPRALGGKPVRVESRKVPRDATLPGKLEFVKQDLVRAAERDVTHARGKLDAALESISKLQAQAVREGKPPESEKTARALQAALEELPFALQAIPVAEAKLVSLRATLEAERIEDAGDRTSEVFARAAREAQADQRSLGVLELRLGQARARHVVVKADDDKKRGEARKKLAETDEALAKAEAEAAKSATTDYVRRKVESYPATTTGRRSALAAWIADAENPLTARVAVNHVWMRHFGRALVTTVFDFGTQGQRPSHPALLDWLAVEFIREGWSLKKLHRLLVTSATYRMDSTPDSAALASDPENRFLWRMSPRRLEAEAVRDSLLYVSGRLDPTRGGPELDENQGLASPRRSLYFRHTPERRMEFIGIFDGAGATECYARTPTIVPQQALALLNSTLTLDGADLLAKKLSGDGDFADFVMAAFESVLSRPPTPREREECARFMSGGDSPRARGNLIHVLLNHHEFVTVR